MNVFMEVIEQSLLAHYFKYFLKQKQGSLNIIRGMGFSSYPGTLAVTGSLRSALLCVADRALHPAAA